MNTLYIDAQTITMLPYIASLIITIILAFSLAFIPASIAKKKGYSSVGFYFFGFAALLPAIIVALVIPNKIEQAKKDQQTEELKQEIRELKEIIKNQNNQDT